MAARAFFDTNVLVYAFDRMDEAKQRVARNLIDESVASGAFVASLQVLQEFYAVTTRKLARPLEPLKARKIVAEFTHSFIVEPTAGLLLQAIDLSIRRQVSFWDSMIVASAITAGCATLYSEDFTNGSEIEGLRVHNPFRTGAAPPRP